MSTTPPSADPDSTPLRWIPESMPLAEVPENRRLTGPPPPVVDLDLGPPTRRMRPATMRPPPTGFGAAMPALAPAAAAPRHMAPPPEPLPHPPPPPSSRRSTEPPSAPPSAPPESTPLGFIPESAPLSGVPESRPIRVAAELSQLGAVPGATTARFVAMRALKLIFSRRRLSHPGTCDALCEACFAPHLAKAEGFVKRGRPLHFVLPAFPAKSPNPRKVLGPLPDMAEVVALTFLQNLCTRIRTFYAPGAKITICSDGRVFSDLVSVSDDEVSAYGREIRVILEQLGADAIDLFTLEDQFGAAEYGETRRLLVERYAKPLHEVEQRIAEGGPALTVFNGIARFLFEDAVGLAPDKSRSLVRKVTKAQAYQVIQRSDAWSSLVADAFPGALRLSIHPQPAHSDKIGIHLVETLDNWLTPWHATAVKAGGRYVLMKRYHAERMGATLVQGGVRPSHFVADTIDLELLRSGREAPQTRERVAV